MGMQIFRSTLVSVVAAALIGGPRPAMAEHESSDSYLDMGLAQLMQVTLTSVAKKEQSLDRTAAAAYVISQSDIATSGATSIPELLAMVPGIQVARISGSKWAVSSRGFGGYTSNKLLVMIDGRSVYSLAYSGTYWDMHSVLLEDIERIEVIRGPGATLWGANAVNGVINIITRSAQQTQATLVRGSFGSQERSLASRFGTAVGDKAYGRVYAVAGDRESNTLDHSDQGGGLLDYRNDANDGWQDMQAGFRFDGITDAHNDWTVTGDVFKSSGDQIISPFWIDTPPYLTASIDDFETSGANLTGTWLHRFTRERLITFKSYLDTNSREESYFEQNFTTLDVDLQYESPLGEYQNLTMGVGYRLVDGDFGSTFQVEIPDQTRSVVSAFVQDELQLIEEELWLTLGTKFEVNEFTGTEWQPSGRLLWKPQPAHTLWASVARALRTPSIMEDNGRITLAAFPIFIPPATLETAVLSLHGSSDFRPEEVLAYEAGYRWQARDTLSFDLAVYFNDYKEIYSYSQGDDPLSFNIVNNIEGNGYGVEVAANWQPVERLSFNLAYSWQNMSLHWQGEDTGVAERIIYNSNQPSHMVSLRSRYLFSERWQTNLWLRYMDDIRTLDPLVMANEVHIPAQVQFDANLIWQPVEDVEVMLVGRNLFYDGKTQYASEVLVPATEIGRDVYVKISWKF